jgi:DNA-binding response OmpR family regulator
VEVVVEWAALADLADQAQADRRAVLVVDRADRVVKVDAPEAQVDRAVEAAGRPEEAVARVEAVARRVDQAEAASSATRKRNGVHHSVHPVFIQRGSLTP